MILITDGGSTKCDWVLLDAKGDSVFQTSTKGLNPAVFSENILKDRIKVNNELIHVAASVENVEFYGAGCGTETPRNILKKALQGIFTNANVIVREDIYAAVYAVTNSPGIVCILGTGSNSCYFDGDKIELPMESLGYILMDEASGNYFGKQLIRDYYYKNMPESLAEDFEKEYDLNADSIKTNLYKKENPNAYLAHFAQFIFNHPDEDAYFYNLLHVGISHFIKEHILCFDKAHELPIHFVGSIAHFSEDIIKVCLENHDLKLGRILRHPIDGLIEHYKREQLK